MVRTIGRIKMGPNNVRRVVWALGKFFCFLFCVIFYYWIFIGCIYDLGKREMVRTTRRIKMGPNDVRCVVWALGEFFCFFFFFVLYYFILMDVLLYL